MALSATGVFEVRSGGSDNNAGYFNPGGGSPGTDYSQQDAAQVTIDGATVTAAVHSTTTQINITGATVSAAWNRNGLSINGGTATAGLYEITAVDVPNNRVTVDRSAGTAAQTVTGTMGGGKATPGAVAAVAVAGNVVWCRGDGTTYNLSGTANVAGGRLAFSAASITLRGYGTTRGDGGRPIFKNDGTWGADSSLVSFGGFYGCIQDIRLDGNNTNRTAECVTWSSGVGAAFRVSAENYTRTGINANSNACAYFCSSTPASVGSSVAFSNTVVAYRCRAKGAFAGFGGNGASQCVDCVADGCTTGFNLLARWNSFAIQCVAYNCTTGFGSASSNQGAQLYVNCVAVSCTTPFAGATSYQNTILRNCANHSGTNSGSFDSTGYITLTANPLVDAVNGDYSLNSTSGGGAALRGAGFGTYGWSGTTGYPDIGAAQAQPSSSSVIVVDED